MSTIDSGLTLLKSAAGRVSAANGWMGNAFKGWMPTGLYARALLIMIVPMVILQSVVAFVFMERHWNTVTRRLSAAVVQDIAALIDVYKGYPQDKDRNEIRRIAQQRLGLVVDFLPAGDMPPPGPKPFFSLLDQTLSVQLGRQIGRSFWIDTVGNSNLVDGNSARLLRLEFVEPTPPPAPVIKTVCPASTFAARKPTRAVVADTGTTAASSKLRFDGL
jgi:two-component system osmolarity sensor histidine kinase EnvZ